MTPEEAILILERDNLNNIAIRSGFEDLYDKRNEAFSMAIKSLEQKSILDKIRDEIEEYKSRQLTVAIGVADLEKGKQIALECVLAIIDRYESESDV